MGHNKMLQRRRQKKLAKKRMAVTAKRAKKLGNQQKAAKSPAA